MPNLPTPHKRRVIKRTQNLKICKLTNKQIHCTLLRSLTAVTADIICLERMVVYVEQ